VPLVLHKEMVDGSTVHEDFSKSAWEAAMHDSGVSRKWGHRPGNCRDSVREFLAELDAERKAQSDLEETTEVSRPPATTVFPAMPKTIDQSTQTRPKSEKGGQLKFDFGGDGWPT